jgi:hypothetical protein
MNTRTALVGSAFAWALVGVSGIASAQVQTQPLGPGIPVDMPAGVTSEPSPPREAPRPRIPAGENVLEQIQTQSATDSRGGSPAAPQQEAPTPQAALANCQTNPATGAFPSDIIGAVGPTNLVVVTNVDIGVFSKTSCAPLSFVPLRTLFGPFGIPASEFLFDPQVIYDPSVGRFFATVESRNLTAGNTDQFQYFAVSQDSTGTSWFLYRVILSQGASFFCKPSAAHFWDYPHAGWVNGANPRWHITANVFMPGGGPFSNGAALSIEKNPTLVGASSSVRCLSQSLPGNTAATLVEDGNNTAFLLSPGSGSGSAIARLAFTPGANTSLDTIVATPGIPIPAWTAAPPANQPNGTVLDTLDGRFQSATIQRGTNLWNVHTVNFGGAVARAYRFSTTGTTALGIATLFTSPTDRVFNPSIATNSVIAFVTATRTDPGAGSPAGNAAMLIFNGSNTLNLAFAFDVVATSAAQFVGPCTNPGFGVVCRWGDYSATQIDPANHGVAWGFNQLVTGPTFVAPDANWTTRAGAAVSLQAPTSRISNFLFACNGQNQSTSFTFGSLPTNTTVLVTAAELVLFENRGGLQYVLLSVNGDRSKQLANMGLPASAGKPGGGGHIFNASEYGLASATTDGTGQVRIQVDGACNGGFGNLQGTATVWFSGPAAL